MIFVLLFVGIFFFLVICIECIVYLISKMFIGFEYLFDYVIFIVFWDIYIYMVWEFDKIFIIY